MNELEKSVVSNSFAADPNAVASRLRGFRCSLSQTQAEFADRLAISRKTLSELENAKKLPRGLLLHGLECCFGVNRGWLLTGEGAMVIGSKEGMPGRGSAEVIELVSGFNRLDDEDRKKLFEVLNMLLFREELDQSSAGPF